MIRIIVEIKEMEQGTSTDFRTEEDHATEPEKFWAGKIYPVLTDALNPRGLVGERGFLNQPETKP